MHAHFVKTCIKCHLSLEPPILIYIYSQYMRIVLSCNFACLFIKSYFFFNPGDSLNKLVYHWWKTRGNWKSSIVLKSCANIWDSKDFLCAKNVNHSWFDVSASIFDASSHSSSVFNSLFQIDSNTLAELSRWFIQFMCEILLGLDDRMDQSTKFGTNN